MDTAAVLAAYDEQVRRHPERGQPARAERGNGVVRYVTETGAWGGITWSDLPGLDVDAVIAAQLRHFAGRERPWEWKHYSHDLPAELPERLLAAGFTAEPPEAMLAAETAALALAPAPPDGVTLAAVTGERGIAGMVAVQDEVFGGDNRGMGQELLHALRHAPDSAAGVIAFADGVPVSAARIEFHRGTDFASLYGGSTLEQWRRRGIFRALVAYRAALARERGYRYLQVDASDDSRPILLRLGFQQLCVTTPYIAPTTPIRPV
jgi:GNAT superfamily N-acetyltransferase